MIRVIQILLLAGLTVFAAVLYEDFSRSSKTSPAQAASAKWTPCIVTVAVVKAGYVCPSLGRYDP